MRRIATMEEHIKKALEIISEIHPTFNINDPHNVNTHKRIVKAWLQMCGGLYERDFEFTTFPKDELELDDNWVIKKDIEFSSLCQHHFMPFFGKVSIGYVANEKICGISKLDRIVHYYSKRPQVQERLGNEIHDFLWEQLRPRKLAIIIDSVHTCVACRGIESRNSSMITTHGLKNDVLEFKEMMR